MPSNFITLVYLFQLFLKENEKPDIYLQLNPLTPNSISLPTSLLLDLTTMSNVVVQS